MKTYITTSGEIHTYDNKSYMKKCYEKNKEKYNAQIYCELCNKSFGKTNTFHHNNTKIHLALMNYKIYSDDLEKAKQSEAELS